jgi:hypothetical protein
MKNGSPSLKRGETTFRRKGEILLQSWRDNLVVNMISTIHDSTMVGSERGKTKYPARRCHIFAAHKRRSETRYICKFCLVPLHKG